MRNRCVLAIILLVLFSISKVAAQSRESGVHYTISYINQVIIDQQNGNDTENYAAVFSKGQDTVTVYKWSTRDSGKPMKINFWGDKSHSANTVSFLSSDGADIKVAFLKENKIRIDSDLYRVNKAYYDFLKQKLLIERSVLDLAFFIKEDYGDYAVSLEPLLHKNWRNQKENLKHRIIEVKVKNKNEQTDDQFHIWNAVYTYRSNGILQSIKGEYYHKKLISDTGGEIKYLVEKNLDRSYVKILARQNKKTLLDTFSVSWTQLSTAKEFHYARYQSKLKQIIADERPGNFSEIAKLLKCFDLHIL